MSYLFDQGYGQLSIQNKARKNEVVLADPQIPQKTKVKIKNILKYKKFFTDFFALENVKIYRKTTFLEKDFVSVLVIASKFNEISAHKECFWIVGCFPYLGFFSEESAQNHVMNLESKGYVTYKRYVYAYSTLGHFEDRILSSFFRFNDQQLAELIFHELFHLIFFVKDDGNLNENLAQYFGEELSKIYFGKKWKKKLDTRKLRKIITQNILKFKKSFESKKIKNKHDAKSLVRNFSNKKLMPLIQDYCQKMNWKYCPYSKGVWNNARMATFLTYNEHQDPLKKLRRKGMSLQLFYKKLKNSYTSFLNQKGIDTFSAYLHKNGLP